MSKNIHTAIIEIMKEVGYVQKQRKGGLNYSYAGEAALISALRPVMIEHGVYSYVTSVSYSREAYETKGGTKMNLTLATGVVKFTHAESDTFIDASAVGEGADVGDKSASKAMTGMLKYALRQTFLIETGDDPDNFSSSSMERGKKETEKQAQEPGGTAISWSPETIIAIVEAGYSQNKYSVENTLKKTQLTPEIPDTWILKWFKFYRAARDMDKTSDESVTIATDQYMNEIAKAKEGK